MMGVEGIVVVMSGEVVVGTPPVVDIALLSVDVLSEVV